MTEDLHKIMQNEPSNQSLSCNYLSIAKKIHRPTHKRRRPAQNYAKEKLYLITILQLLEYVQSVCSPTAISAFTPCFANWNSQSHIKKHILRELNNQS